MSEIEIELTPVKSKGSYLDDYVLERIEMEKESESKTGRGTVYYEKDGKSYTLIATFVDGKKEGKGVLLNDENEVVTKLTFLHDEVINELEGNERREDEVIEVNEKLKKKLNRRGKSKKLKIVNGKKRSSWWMVLWIVVGLIGVVVGYELIFYVIMMIRASGQLTIHNCEEYRHLPSFSHSRIHTLLFADGSCSSLSSLLLSSFINCQSIEIGSNALMNVRRVEASGLKKLKSMKVDEMSLLNVEK